MAEVARIERIGDLKTSGEFLERSASEYHNELVHHLDFDSAAGVDTTTKHMRVVPKELAQNSYNLLDALSLDWRDPNFWDQGDKSKITYNPIEDCIEIHGRTELYSYKGLSIFHDLGFRMSCEMMSVGSGGTSRVYVGGRMHDKRGAVLPTTLHQPGSWDYLCAANVYPPMNVWTKYDNSYVGGRDRIGVVAGSGDQSKWKTDKGVYFAPLILCNYSQDDTRILRVRNLRIYYTGESGKVIPNGKGLFLGDKQNLSNNPPYKDNAIYSGWGDMKAKRELTHMLNGDIAFKYKFHGTTGGIHYRTTADQLAVEGGAWYTISMMVQCKDISKLHPNAIYIRQYNEAGAQTLAQGHATYFSSLGEDWYLVRAVQKLRDDTKKMTIHSYNYPNFATEFIQGGETVVKGHSACILPYAPNVTQSTTSTLTMRIAERDSWTVVGSFICGDTGANDLRDIGTSYNELMLSFIDQDGKSCHFRSWYSNGTIHHPYLDPDIASRWNNTNNNQHIHAGIALTQGTQYFWSLKSTNGSDVHFQIRDDKGNVLITLSLPNSITNAPKLNTIIFNKQWATTHRSLSVFSRYLGDIEITDLIKTRMSVSDRGIVDNFDEVSKTLDPKMIDVDMRMYADNAYGGGYGVSRVGSNYIRDDYYNHMQAGNSARANKNPVISTPYGKGHIWTKESTNVVGANTLTSNYQLIDIPRSALPALGTKMVLSAWVYMSHDWDGGNDSIRIEQDIADLTYHNYDLNKKGTWQFVKIYFTHRGGHNKIRCLEYLRINTKTKGHAIVADMKLGIQVPDIKPKRVEKLTFDLHTDYKLDYSKAFTIAYWKKPINSHTVNSRNGYSIDSIGSNNPKLVNDSTGGYIWWGKENTSNSIKDVKAFDPNKYWEKWRLIVITRNTGGTIKIYEISEEGVFVRNTGVNPTIPDFFRVKNFVHNGRPTTDLQLGGWDYESTRSSGIFKKLMIGQVGVTESQVRDYFKEALSLMKSGVKVNGELIEAL